MKKIISDTVRITKTNELCDVESVLLKTYGDVVRWAIIDMDDEYYKISISYVLKEA